MGIRVCLVGAHVEDNLSIGYLASCLRESGHEVRVVVFDGPEMEQSAVEKTTASSPDIVGISFACQHRALENIELAARLREGGFDGHLTCGGQFPSAVPEKLLENAGSFDSVVLGEGEYSIVDLAGAIERGGALESVGSLVWRDGEGIRRNRAGRVVEDLDSIPHPARDLAPGRDVGLAASPVLGSRGCRHKCSFCSIRAFSDAHPGSVPVRVRSPGGLAQEMSELHERRGVRLFQFHDDVLPLSEGPDPVAYYRALAMELERRKVDTYVSICPLRPDLIGHGALPEATRSLNIVRFYFGIESGSEAVLRRLSRGVSRGTVQRALETIRSSGIPGGTNLLLFDPETTLDDVEESLEMMRRYPCVPYNFCKVEAYYGTRLYDRLEAEGRLSGSWISPSYRLSDPAAEAACQISMHVMRDRISTSGGLLESVMSLTHRSGVMEYWRVPERTRQELEASASHLIEQVSLDTTLRLLEVVEYARRADYTDLDGNRDFASDAAFRCNERGAEFYVMLDEITRAVAATIRGE